VEQLSTRLKKLNGKLLSEILNFCRHVAGTCPITAACICGDYIFGAEGPKMPLEVLLVIRDFQPRLMNYIKIIDERSIIVIAVDEWVFERDVDGGFLGEAFAGELILPYLPLIGEEYLKLQEVKLKRRLILELLENLVFSFPELSYSLHIKPEYFLYETLMNRARLFPPIMYSLAAFMRRNGKAKNIERALLGYLKALKELENEKVITFSNGYVKISEKFIGAVKKQKTRFISLFKTAQRAVFISLLSILPKTISYIPQSREIFLRSQKLWEQIEDPSGYLFVPTARGLVPLVNRVNIEVFAREMLQVGGAAKFEVKELGGVLNDVYLVKIFVNDEDRKVVAKRFRDWSSFKWFPLTLWTLGTRTFAVLGRSRLEREFAINQLLSSMGFAVPKILHVNQAERLIFMEYVEGEDLEKMVKRIVTSKVNAVEKELDFIEKVGETFAKAHALNIALGDTRVQNLVVGKNGEIYLLDFEQASRNGDKAWDVAEFLYYAGHYVPPFAGTRPAELIVKAFIEGYLKAGGNVEIIKKAGNPKYTKVFSVFTLPHIIVAISSMCKNAGQLKG
jgi:tRNA A-37 threonylcarbamoyl transferase component Bud32